jgi:hypothetical protein
MMGYGLMQKLGHGMRLGVGMLFSTIFIRINKLVFYESNVYAMIWLDKIVLE